MQDWHSAAAASARLGLRGHFGGGEGFGKQCCEFLLNSSGLPSCRAKRLCKMRSTARCGSELAPNSVSGVDDIAAKARRAARCVLHDALERLLETNRGLRYSNEALAAARRLAAEREEAERAAFAAAVADWRKGSGPVLVEREDIGLRSRAPREIGRAKSLWMGPWRSVIWQLCGERLSCCDFESSSQAPTYDASAPRRDASSSALCPPAGLTCSTLSPPSSLLEAVFRGVRAFGGQRSFLPAIPPRMAMRCPQPVWHARRSKANPLEGSAARARPHRFRLTSPRCRARGRDRQNVSE
ncbi:unnamed protein product, partial [Prorocentrum cordatum]